MHQTQDAGLHSWPVLITTAHVLFLLLFVCLSFPFIYLGLLFP